MQDLQTRSQSFRSQTRASRRVLSALAFLLSSAASSAPSARAQILIQFSHVVAPDTAKGKAAQRFKELAELRTRGRVKVEVYPNSELYKDREELEALQLGAVQMLAPSLSKFAALGVRDFEVFGLPFLFRDHAAFRAVTRAPVGTALLEKLESKGIKGLAYWDNGFQLMTANRPLHRVSDFKGLRMRIQSSRVLAAQMRALGAIPKVTPLVDQYAALKSGQLDGSEGVPSNLYTQRIHEVQKHITVSNHGYLAYAVVVNKTFWMGLPADIRLALESALRDVTVFGNERAATENARALEKIKASGTATVYELTPKERAAWKQALIGVHGAGESRIDKAILREVYAAAGFAP